MHQICLAISMKTKSINQDICPGELGKTIVENYVYLTYKIDIKQNIPLIKEGFGI